MVCQCFFFMNTDIGPSSDLVWVINLLVISQWKSDVNVKTTLKYRQNIFRHQPRALPEWLFGFGIKIYRPITHSDNDEQCCPAECLEGRSCRMLHCLLKHFGPVVEVEDRVRQKTMSVNKNIPGLVQKEGVPLVALTTKRGDKVLDLGIGRCTSSCPTT